MYKQAVVNPGEMVGVVAAQSVGEPTTQMSETKNAVKKIIIVSKNGMISHKTIKIGELCDKFIEDYPEYTFPTGHPDSVETNTSSSFGEMQYFSTDTNTIFPPKLCFKWDDSVHTYQPSASLSGNLSVSLYMSS